MFPGVKFHARVCRNTDGGFDEGFYLMATGNDNLLQQIDREKFHVYDFFTDKAYLIASENHPLAKYKTVSIKKALEYPFVLMQPEDAVMNPVYDWCEGNGMHMTVALETDHLMTYINAIRGGDVVGCWPQIALTMNELHIHKDLKIIELNHMPAFHVFGLVHTELYQEHEDIVQAILQIIRQNM